MIFKNKKYIPTKPTEKSNNNDENNYIAVYKCPLCGALIQGGKPFTINRNELPGLLGKFVSMQQFASNPYLDVPSEKVPHKCPDGSAGLAPFVGFKKL